MRNADAGEVSELTISSCVRVPPPTVLEDLFIWVLLGKALTQEKMSFVCGKIGLFIHLHWVCTARDVHEWLLVQKF